MLQLQSEISEEVKQNLSNLYPLALVSCTVQKNFNGSNIDGSFTTAVSNSFLVPREKIP